MKRNATHKQIYDLIYEYVIWNIYMCDLICDIVDLIYHNDMFVNGFENVILNVYMNVLYECIVICDYIIQIYVISTQNYVVLNVGMNVQFE